MKESNIKILVASIVASLAIIQLLSIDLFSHKGSYYMIFLNVGVYILFKLIYEKGGFDRMGVNTQMMIVGTSLSLATFHLIPVVLYSLMGLFVALGLVIVWFLVLKYVFKW